LATKGLESADKMIAAKATADKQQQDDKKKADADAEAQKKKAEADKKTADDAAQKAQSARQQTGLAEMKSNAAQFLAIADSKSSPELAEAFAKEIVSNKFGDNLPLDLASTLFSVYHKENPGAPGTLTQGSAAFLKALRLDQ
jgi:hypothetical protein